MANVGTTTAAQRAAILAQYKHIDDADLSGTNTAWYEGQGEAPHDGTCYLCEYAFSRDEPETRVYTLSGHEATHDVCHGCLSSIIAHKGKGDKKCYGHGCKIPITYESLVGKVPIELIERYKYVNDDLVYTENANVQQNTALNVFQRQFSLFTGTKTETKNNGYGGNNKLHTNCPVMCPYCLQIDTMLRKNFACMTAIAHTCDGDKQSPIMRAKYPKLLNKDVPLEGNYCLVCGRPSARTPDGHGGHYDTNLEHPALVPTDAVCPTEGLNRGCGGRRELIARALGAQAKAQEQQARNGFTNSSAAHEERVLAANAAAFNATFLGEADKLIRENPWMVKECQTMPPSPPAKEGGGKKKQKRRTTKKQKKHKGRKTRRHR